MTNRAKMISGYKPGCRSHVHGTRTATPDAPTTMWVAGAAGRRPKYVDMGSFSGEAVCRYVVTRKPHMTNRMRACVYRDVYVDAGRVVRGATEDSIYSTLLRGTVGVDLRLRMINELDELMFRIEEGARR